MTAVEAYELITQGGATDFATSVRACEIFGPYCLIGGLAVNAYVEPVYTLDADIAVVGTRLAELSAHLEQQEFKVQAHRDSVNATGKASQLRVQFTADERYQQFLTRAVDAEVLGIRVKVASLEDVAQGKLWAWSDPQRRLSKRKKDELDLIRLAETYPHLKAEYPGELRELIDRG